MNVIEFMEKNGGEFYNLDGSDQDDDKKHESVMIEITVAPHLYQRLKYIAESDDVEAIAELIVEIIQEWVE